MSWFEKILPRSVTNTTVAGTKKNKVPDGVWTKCPECEQILYVAELQKNLEVCPQCDHHLRIGARERLTRFLDENSIVEIGTDLEPKDILKFKDLKRYKDRLTAAQKATGEREALIAMQGTLFSRPVIAMAFEFNFIGGSMSSVVGALFVRAAEKAIEQKCPVICFSTSGGARMQEALYSLMQMAKTSAVVAKLNEAKIPFISVLTDPTMGGVSASFAMLGDLNIAEPKALIGFAGPRVIEQTVREKLPEGFQRSEFLLEKGAIDMIIHRRDMRPKLASLLAKMMNQSNPLTAEPESPVEPAKKKTRVKKMTDKN